MARTALSMTRLAEALDDQTFHISALTKRIKELEEQQDPETTLSLELRRIKQLENNRHLDMKSHESTYRDIVLRLRALEETSTRLHAECSVIGDVPTVRGQSPAGARKYRKYQVHKQIDDMIKGMARLQELIGPPED